MSNGFGKANLDNTFEGFKYFKLKTPDPSKGEESTELVLRLIPSIHSYAESGQWKFFYGQHYGHFGNNSRNPDKPRSRPFGCIQRKNKAKEILVSCPKCVQIESVREKQRTREKQLDQANPNNSQVQMKDIYRADKIHAELGKWLGSHNCDKKFWMNVMSHNGEFGVLQLSYKTTEEVLMPLLRRLRDEGIDALDVTAGVYLRFIRTGRRPSVTDRIEEFTETVDLGGGRKGKVPKPAPLTQEQQEKALKILPDLKTSVVKFIDAETMQRLVSSSGDPDETDRIWPPEVRAERAAINTAATTATAATATINVEEDEFVPEEEETVVQTKPVVATKTVQVEEAVDPSEAELEAKLAALRAKKKAPVKVAASNDAVEDFLKDFDAKA